MNHLAALRPGSGEPWGDGPAMSAFSPGQGRAPLVHRRARPIPGISLTIDKRRLRGQRLTIPLCDADSGVSVRTLTYRTQADQSASQIAVYFHLEMHTRKFWICYQHLLFLSSRNLPIASSATSKASPRAPTQILRVASHNVQKCHSMFFARFASATGAGCKRQLVRSLMSVDADIIFTQRPYGRRKHAC